MQKLAQERACQLRISEPRGFAKREGESALGLARRAPAVVEGGGHRYFEDAPRGSSSTNDSASGFLSTITYRSVRRSTVSSSSVSWPGRSAKRSSCCRTTSYSATVISICSSQPASPLSPAPHSQRNSKTRCSPSSPASAALSSRSIRSFISRMSDSFRACRSRRESTTTSSTPPATSAQEPRRFAHNRRRAEDLGEGGGRRVRITSP
jgi:hypothetical protein